MRNVTPKLSFDVQRFPARDGRGLVALIFFRGWLVQFVRALDTWLLEAAIRDWIEINEYDAVLYALPDAPSLPAPVQNAPESTETAISGALAGAFECWPVQNGLRFILRPFGDAPEEFASAGLPGHDGVDLPARSGDDVVAPVAGNITAVIYLPDFGWVVRLNSGLRMGNTVAQVSINLGPLECISINPFAPVEAGDVLGQVGDGCVLHLSVTRHSAPAYVDRCGAWPAGIFDPTPLLLPLMGEEGQ